VRRDTDCSSSSRISAISGVELALLTCAEISVPARKCPQIRCGCAGVRLATAGSKVLSTVSPVRDVAFTSKPSWPFVRMFIVVSPGSLEIAGCGTTSVCPRPGPAYR